MNRSDPRPCRTCGIDFVPTEKGKTRQCKPCNAADSRAYSQAKKNGTYVSRKKKIHPCSIDGCSQMSIARDMCKFHWDRWKYNSDPAYITRPKFSPIHEDFYSHCEAVNGCWEWTRSCDADGYGHLVHQGSLKGAHRHSYELSRGNIPDGLFVLHECDNRKCINPDHLFLGTNMDNMRDMYAKGRAWFQKRKGDMGAIKPQA